MSTFAERLQTKLEEKAVLDASALSGASIFTEGTTPTQAPVVELEEEEKVPQELTTGEIVDVSATIEKSITVSEDVELEVAATTEEVVPTIVNIEEQLTVTMVETVVPEEAHILVTQPTLADSSAFQKLTSSSETTGLNGNDSYSELVESMVSQQCQMSGVKNLDLTTFGLRAQVLNFPNLSVMNYGVHKFLGAPFTEDEENLIIHRLGLHVAQSDKSRIVVRAVQEVKDGRGMSFYSLLFNDDIAQRFANMFNYTVHANINEADVSKLVLVIQK